MESKTLFTWIHISDIHIGHGDEEYQKNQKLVLESLLTDLKHVRDNFQLTPDAIFVTGDIAFSGNIRSRNEYRIAKNWLNSIGALLGLTNEQIYVIPGNHDVQRNIANDDEDIKLWLDDLRLHTRKLGNLLNALKSAKGRQRVVQRLRNYLNFAKDFSPYIKVSKETNSPKTGASIHGTKLFWSDVLDLSNDRKLQLVGYNTAILSQDDKDRNRLALTETQLNYPFTETQKGDIVLIMSHHSFDWLEPGDSENVTIRTNSRADIHLCGHIHNQKTWSFRAGNGTGLVSIVSGAAHGELEKDPKIPPKHAYNWALLEEGADGIIVLKVYPRIWIKNVDEFRTDGELTLKDHSYARHDFTHKVRRHQSAKPNYKTSPAAKFIDPAQMLLGPNIDEGREALEMFIEQGDAAIPQLIELLKQIDDDWPRTHLEQVLYRFKLLFARSGAASTDILCDLVCGDDWRMGSRAAECFDFFDDTAVKTQTANKIAESFIDSSDAHLLDAPDPVRNSIKALGYLGAYEWSHAIREVLRKTKEKTKFRHWAFISYAWMHAKIPSSKLHNLGMVDFEYLFKGFSSGEFSIADRPVTDDELQLIKKIIVLRKDKRQADYFLKRVKRNQWSDHSDAESMACECYAHILGSIGLPPAIPILKEIILRDGESTALRAESTLALSRIKHKDAARALREASESITTPIKSYQDASYNTRFYALLALSQVAHITSDPATTIDYVLEQMKIKEFHIGELIRAVGLCKASKYTEKLEALLSREDAELRGQAGLALARIHGTKALPRLEESLESCTSAIDGILFSLAVLESGGKPSVEFIKNCLQGRGMEPGIVEWKSLIVEDTFQILDKASEEYGPVLSLWKDVLETLPPKLPFIYTNISGARAIPEKDLGITGSRR